MQKQKQKLSVLKRAGLVVVVAALLYGVVAISLSNATETESELIATQNAAGQIQAAET